jgi:hypothetical protein
MSVGEKIRTFNDLVESFLKQMAPIIGTSYHHYFTKLIQFNAVMPIKNFLHYAIPMKDKILNRDETYFTNPDNHIDKIKESKEENALDEIIRLKGIWEQLSDESKVAVWDMTTVMLYTAMEYLDLKK